MFQIQRVSRNQKTNKWGQTRQFVVFSDEDGREWKSMWNVQFQVIRQDEAGQRAAEAVARNSAARRLQAELERALDVQGGTPNLTDRVKPGDRFTVEAGAVEFDGEWASIRKPRGEAVVIRVGARVLPPAIEARRVRGPFTSRKGNLFFMGTTLQESKWRSTLFFPASESVASDILSALDCGKVMLTGRVVAPEGTSRRGTERFMMFGVEPQLPISVAPEVVRELEIEDVPPAPAREPEVEASGRAWGLEIYSDAEVQAAKAAAEAAQFRGLERDYTPKPPTGPVEIDARFSMLELD